MVALDEAYLRSCYDNHLIVDFGIKLPQILKTTLSLHLY